MGDIRALSFYRPEYSELLLKKLQLIFDDWLSAWSCIDINSQTLCYDISRADNAMNGPVLSIGKSSGMKLVVNFDPEPLNKIYNLLLFDYDLSSIQISDNSLILKMLTASVGELIKNIVSELDLSIEGEVKYEEHSCIETKRYHDVYNIKLGPINIHLPSVLLPRNVSRIRDKRTSRIRALASESTQLEVKLTGVHLKVSDLVKLKPGQVLITDTLLSQPFELQVAGKKVTECYLGKKSNNKAIIVS